MTKNVELTKAFTIIEMLVSIVIFVIIGLIATSGVLTTLRGARRSDSDAKVRENVSFALGTVERHLRNARTVTCPSGSRVDYVDQQKTAASFFLQTNGTDRYIASASANTRLTSPDVAVTSFTVSCSGGVGNIPLSVDIAVTAQDSTNQGAESSLIQSNIKVDIRTSY